MAKEIYGIGSCAKAIGVGFTRIRHLIVTKKIRPKKVKTHWGESWCFSEHDQEIIRRSTSGE